jgi:putative transcriptional regulator
MTAKDFARPITKLKLLRLKHGLTQKQAARAIGIDDGNLSKMEAGKYEIKLDTALKIANFYDVPVEKIWQRGAAPGKQA